MQISTLMGMYTNLKIFQKINPKVYKQNDKYTLKYDDLFYQNQTHTFKRFKTSHLFRLLK